MKKVILIFNNLIKKFQQIHVFRTTLDDLIVKFLLLAILVFLITWLLPSERPFEYSNLTVGSIAREEIIAPFTFPILKTEEELKKEREEAWLNVPLVFEKDTLLAQQQSLKIQTLKKQLALLLNREDIQSILSEKKPIQSKKLDSLVQDLNLKFNLTLNTEDLRIVQQIVLNNKWNNLLDNLNRALQEVYGQGVIDKLKENFPERQVSVIENGVEEIINKEDVFDIKEAGGYIYNLLKLKYGENSPELKIADHLIDAFLIPNLKYNKDVTIERKERAVHDVPPTRGFVYKNQRIIDSHEIVTEDVYRKLQSLAVALKERSALRGGWQKFKFLLGKYLFALTLIFLVILYLYFYRQQIFKNNLMLSMIVLIFSFQFALVALFMNVLHWPYISTPVILAPMLLSMLLDAGIAFLGTVFVSFSMGAFYGNDYTFTFMSLIVGTIALYSVLKIRNRAQMFKAILYISFAYLVVHFSFGFLHLEPVNHIFKNYLFYLLPNAILAPTAVFLLIGVFERMFDVTTDITLLELSDLNHPLLKRLSVEAPGTFHHSIIIGNLAEAAAKAIGANPLLARVGSYYHDIGKMLKPEYFVENQMGAENKHENLSPKMSCLILANHVKGGLELADKYNLPKAIKQFIPEHHGTSLMSYFYHKALEIMDPKDINEDDFRYPGPKPQSKETAIVMLADTVEAASRTLQNPTPQRIRSLVDSLIKKKLDEGQLDESNLTLRELNLIKEAFIHILMGIHHVRIEYPEKEESTFEAVKQKSKIMAPAKTNGPANKMNKKDNHEAAD